MDLTVEDLENGIRRINLSGRMDIEGTGAISTKLTSYTATFDNPRIVIDMSRVDYLTSLGIGTLVNVFQAVGRRRGKLVLFDLQQPVAKVLELSKIDQAIPVVKDFTAACALVIP